MEPLAHLAVIWCSVLVAIAIARRTRMTSIFYYVLLGAVLVNAGILPEESHPFIRTLSDISVVLILFALGFRESTDDFLASLRRSWAIALFGAVAPFFTAYGLATWFWDEPEVALFAGVAMTAASVPLAMASLSREHLAESRAAGRLKTAGLLEDVAILALIAVLVPVATEEGAFTAGNMRWLMTKAVLFFVIVVAIGTLVLPHERIGWLARLPLIGKIGVRHLFALGEGEHAPLAVLALAAVTGVLALAFGLHPAVGAYMAGLVLKEEYFRLPHRPDVPFYENTRGIVDNIAFYWIGPVFFFEIGSRLVFDAELFLAVVPEIALLAIALLFAQAGASAIAARFIANDSWADGMTIGLGMLGRAELCFVVIGIAFLQNPIFPEEVFYTLMLTALLLSVATPLAIRWWVPRHAAEMTRTAEPPTAT